MAIELSKYVRQGKKTFRFIRMGGGVYGCDICYEYGVFNDNKFYGLHYELDKETEYESDDDEKDGIGGMTTVRNYSVYVGEFLDGKPNGFCYELKNGRADKPINFGYYEKGVLVRQAEGEVRPDTEYAFEDWQTMPVDPVDGEGFSVLREGEFYNDGGVCYTVTEGKFSGGKLNGLGIVYYHSDVNGYRIKKTEAGVFCNGTLLFGYKKRFQSGGGNDPAIFGYMDEREEEEYGEKTVYKGKTYFGETVNGVPNGIGCLYEGKDEKLVGTFKDGKLHGIGVCYKRIENKWKPYNRLEDRVDTYYDLGSWGIFAEGERRPEMTLEEFFDKYEKVEKV